MILTKKESDEVLYPVNEIVSVCSTDLKELKRLALLNSRHRIRLCSHQNPMEKIQEMFIVHTSDCYVRPHKHIGKIESMSILEGEVDVVLFHEDGSIREVINMGTIESGKKFYNRISEPVYHTLLIRSDFLVFHEITEGPFNREDTIFPDWAPEIDGRESIDFINHVDGIIS